MGKNEALQVRMGEKVGIFNWEALFIQLQQLEVLDPDPALKVPHKRSSRKHLDILLS